MLHNGSGKVLAESFVSELRAEMNVFELGCPSSTGIKISVTVV